MQNIVLCVGQMEDDAGRPTSIETALSFTIPTNRSVEHSPKVFGSLFFLFEFCLAGYWMYNPVLV